MPNKTPDTIDYLDRVGIAALFQNRNVRGFLASDTYDVVLRGTGVLGISNVTYANPRAPDGL
jgi:hypothetical protein